MLSLDCKVRSASVYRVYSVERKVWSAKCRV